MSEYRLIPLSGKHGKGKFAKVSPEDYEKTLGHTWWLSREGYVATSCPKWMALHRLIMNFPDGYQVDHKNHDKLDNRRENLRLCSHQENQRNTKPRKGSSKFKGVSWLKRERRWKVHVRVGGRKLTVGSFKDEMEAARFYDEMAKIHYGEFAYLNFP